MTRRRITHASWLLLCALAGAACGDDATPSKSYGLPVMTQSNGDDASVADDAGVNDAVCVGAKNGVVCGTDHHCIDQQCLWNTCGDGVKAGKEACDDGNEAVGDACDPSCRIVPLRCGDGLVQAGEECDDGNFYDLDACSTACTKNTCGNKRLDGLEECDDGNSVDTDACSNQCTVNRCRNGRVDPGEECDDGNRIGTDECSNACKIQICGNTKVEGREECDDGNTTDDDACSNACKTVMCGNRRIDPGEKCDGDTVDYECSTDCKTKTVGGVSACRTCEEANCRNYMGQIDAVAGCFEGKPLESEVPLVEPMFAAKCIAAVNCARQHDCGYTPGAYGATCYCGSNFIVGTGGNFDPNKCIDQGNAPDAPCVAEWQAATAETIPNLVMANLTDDHEISGWVAYLLQCDVELCAAECVPQH